MKSSLFFDIFVAKERHIMQYKSTIEPNSKIKFSLKEAYRYKDLFLTLSWRDLKIRYAQTALGILWAFIQPIIQILISFAIFSYAFNVDTEEINPILFITCGMCLWTYFSFVLNNSGNSIIQAADMIKKVYFPRLIIPLSKSIVGFVDFGVSLILLLLACVYYNHIPSMSIIFSPIFILQGILAALGVGIWLSALTIRFRDFQHIIPFIVQMGLYATPVAYPAKPLLDSAAQKGHEWMGYVYYLNPMAGAIEGFKWSILDTTIYMNHTILSMSVTLVIFISGILYFNKIERKIADLV